MHDVFGLVTSLCWVICCAVLVLVTRGQRIKVRLAILSVFVCLLGVYTADMGRMYYKWFYHNRAAERFTRELVATPAYRNLGSDDIDNILAVMFTQPEKIGDGEERYARALDMLSAALEASGSERQGKVNFEGSNVGGQTVTCALMKAASRAVAGFDATQFVATARSQIGVTTQYDGSYRKLAYPGGDVPKETGVCCDVIVRALREQGIDLQQLVHEDMNRSFNSYPQNWGLKKPDSNIDHRRVPNLACYFQRAGWALDTGAKAADYLPGDIVTWKLANGLPHIGIVSDKKTPAGTPLVIHNIGSGTREEDVLFGFTITGRFSPSRPGPDPEPPINRRMSNIEHRI